MTFTSLQVLVNVQHVLPVVSGEDFLVQGLTLSLAIPR